MSVSTKCGCVWCLSCQCHKVEEVHVNTVASRVLTVDVDEVSLRENSCSSVDIVWKKS